ncbi:DUF881 domain-containing protein [Ornithinicoccus halotolerans]|uniref:DUF881 domain-containing protein n=1 Tax=Ornithinicoccus halotolerans TaxID=1748220 RepID=UPI0012976D10|nr:DUF881 domain-containing protein [Ornithinicoccus halotolerans]
MSRPLDRVLRWRPPRGRPDPDPAASMALLREVLNRPLDPGYRSAAEQRSAHGLPASTGSRSVLLLVSSLVLGLLVTVGAQSLRGPDTAEAQARSDLADRVGEQRELLTERSARVEELQAEVAVMQEQALDGQSALAEELDRHRRLAGGTPMTGPGLAVVLDDPPRPADVGVPGEDRVLARDLQVLVNGLWAHGAEAIAINEHRLTSTSSIRFAGEAIVVDFQGLTRPYTVTAIGPVDELAAELDSGSTGAYLTELQEEYDIIVETMRDDEVTVPAATRLSVREASVADDAAKEERR